MALTTRVTGQQEKGNNTDYGQKRDITTNFEGSNVEADSTRGPPQPSLSGLVDLPPVIENVQSRSSESSAHPEATTPFDDPDMPPQDVPTTAPSTAAMASLSPVSIVSPAEIPTITIQAYNDSINCTNPVKSAATLSQTTLVEAGAEIGTEALPGVNQDDPKFATTHQVTPFAPVESPATSSSAPENTVYTLPGQNQPDVARASLDLLGISSPALPATSPPPSRSTTTITTYVTVERTLPDPSSATSDTVISSAFSWSTSVASSPSSTPSISSSTAPASSLTAPSISSLPPLPSISSFVLLTRTEQGKEQEKTSTSRFLSPQAVTASSSLFSATVLPTILASPSSLASTASDEMHGGLSPLSKSLFILFGVLGAITVLIAVAIFFMSRRNKRRAVEAENQYHDNTIEEIKESYNYGNMTRGSATSSLNNPTFLTDSEKNIICRAATADGQPEMNISVPGARLNDAISSFIAKSRRLTYKISP